MQGAGDAAVNLLKFVLACVLIISLVWIHLLLLPQAPGQEGWRTLILALLPNFISALFVFPVFYLLLRRVDVSMEEQVVRAIDRAAQQDRGPKRYDNDVHGAASDIELAVQEAIARRGRSRTSTGPVLIEIVAFTGATFTTAVLRPLIEAHPKRLHIHLLLIDFADLPPDASYPGHWRNEADDTEQRLRALCGTGNATVAIARYRGAPLMLGLAVDRHDYFVGVPEWDVSRWKLPDQTITYFHYADPSGREFVSRLFKTFLNRPDRSQPQAENSCA